MHQEGDVTAFGAYDAKTRLSELLDRVAAGESIRITRHGVTVAVLQPPETSARRPYAEVLAEVKTLRAQVHASEDEIRAWIDEGRD